MQMVGNSRPASCAEHHLSHLWEMEVINGPLDALHGEKVSIGTLIVLREYNRIARAIREGRCRVLSEREDDTELLEKHSVRNICWRELSKKTHRIHWRKSVRQDWNPVFLKLQI